MKSKTALLTLTTAFLIFIPFGKLISKKFKNVERIVVNNKNDSTEIIFDTSLRNFHPNKGE